MNHTGGFFCKPNKIIVYKLTDVIKLRRILALRALKQQEQDKGKKRDREKQNM